MYTIYSIIKISREKRKRRVNFISTRKIKFYTKEIIKFFNIALLTFGFIIAIILIKYKPMYEVKISGEQIGYIQSKKVLENIVENDIENYSGKNIENVELKQNPEYELKLIERTKESDESKILISLQKEVEITYKYYEISLNEEKIEQVDSLEVAEQIINEIKEETNTEKNLIVTEKTTTNIEDLNTNTLEVAKENIMKKIDIKSNNTKQIAEINGIKVSTLPITGTISSRYGVSSSIRSSTHTGLDIAAQKGTPIKVIADGTVTFAQKNGSYGNLVKIEHGNGIETWYAHTNTMYVKVGQQVKAGDVIATVGSTGNSTGPHLHLEVRINGQHVNPQKYLYNN